jgi:hypothetical protein
MNMKRLFLGIAFALLAIVGASEVSFSQDYYIYTVIRVPNTGRYKCVVGDERTINFGNLCGSRNIRYGTTYCKEPGTLTCNPVVYSGWNVIGYGFASAQVDGGVLSGRDRVTVGPRTATVTWSAPAAGQAGPAIFVDHEGLPTE